VCLRVSTGDGNTVIVERTKALWFGTKKKIRVFQLPIGEPVPNSPLYTPDYYVVSYSISSGLYSFKKLLCILSYEPRHLAGWDLGFIGALFVSCPQLQSYPTAGHDIR
jgi:hypothetical protein